MRCLPAGDNSLGGDEFDEDHGDPLVTEFYRQQNVDLRKDNTAMQRVREEAEKAKRCLHPHPQPLSTCHLSPL